MEKRIVSSPVSIYALGGLGEVGKNMYCIENDDDIIILDCGVRFPGVEFPGIGNIYRCGVGHHRGLEIRFSLGRLHHLETTFALDNDGDIAVGHLEGLEDLGRSANLV